MKIKPFSGRKRCKDGELYVFKKGIAIVPGFNILGRPAKISIGAFNLMNKGME